MSLLQGCSELQETARLARELMELGSVAPPAVVGKAVDGVGAGTLAASSGVAAPFGATEPVGKPAEAAQAEMPEFAYRGDRLQYILSNLCRRGDLGGAVVADGKGLPLADFNSPVGGESLAAFTSVLGGALERAGVILGENGAELISMDINYSDKAVLRRFNIRGEPYFLMVICSQSVDERTELELSIDQLSAALTE